MVYITFSAPAAEALQQIAQEEGQAGIAPHLEAPVPARMGTVGAAAGFDFVQCTQIRFVVRFHAHCPADMFQRRHLIAQAVIGHSTEVIPPGVFLRGITQCVQRLLILTEADVTVGRLLIIISVFAVV